MERTSHQWQQSHFNTQYGYWNNKNNQRDFMDQLGNRLKYKEMNAWYGVAIKQIDENGGVTLLNKYGGSPSKLVMAVYDTHQWQQSHFNTQHGYRNNKDNQRDFMDQLGYRLGYKVMKDWYGITKKILAKWDILLDMYGNSPSKLVMTVYDTYQWQQSHFNTHYGYWNNKNNQRPYRSIRK